MGYACEKISVYAIVLMIVFSLGIILSQFRSYVDMPQWVFNFLCVSVFSIYMIENWSLLMDLNAKHDIPKDEIAYIEIIHELTTTNNKLVRKLSFLEASSSCKSQQIDNLRNKWNSQCNIPLPDFFDASCANHD